MISALNNVIRRVPISAIYVIGMLPAPWLFYMAATGALGIEPIEALEHRYGELALQFLVVSLAVTPLRRFVGINLLRTRRAIGLLAFFYVICHVLVWALLDVQSLDRIWADILKRPYITIGMAAFILMVPLALTSNNRSVRLLGSAWRRLHKLSYAVGLLGTLHFVWLAKGWQIEPLIYLGTMVLLLLLRLPGPVSRSLSLRRPG
jgi:sulfoxide reductase heme-binding subunit YedZ